jgi:surface antigen/phage tail protein X
VREAVKERLSSFDTAMHRFQRKALDFFKGTSGKRIAEPFRKYGAFSLVVSIAALVSLTNVSQGRGLGNVVLGSLGSGQESVPMPRKKLAAQSETTENLSLVPLASAPASVDLSEKMIEEDISKGDGVLLSAWDQASITKDPEEDGGVTIYTVANGDTISSIAAKYGITVNTILWANDLANADSIKPGDQIFILPIAGLSYVVKSGDTLDSIAAKYKADKTQIIAFNSLPANGELKVGDTIVIPGGSKEVPVSAQDSIRRQYATSTGSGQAIDISGGYRKLEGKAGTGHRFPYGYCTWYVAQKRYVPWSGNAGAWLYNARSMGYRTGKTPAVGAIVVTTENRYYGHVAVVESVGKGTITVSEMNYRAWGKTDRRVLSTSSRVIKGYIY